MVSRALMRPVIGVSVLLLALLFAKFLWPLLAFDLPLGYDVGIYRYLFLRHAEGFPPFAIADMDLWAREHPLGLFVISSVLIKLGLPVDWLIGWIWNLVPVAVLSLLAWATTRRWGFLVGVFTLLTGLLSVAYYDGFSGMYWKTYAALFWMVLTFALLDRKSWLAVIPGLLTLVTHHQTGLLFGLVVGTYWFLQGIKHWQKPMFQRATVVGGVVIVLAALVYAPVWRDAVDPLVAKLLTTWGDPSIGGNFPPLLYYVRASGLLLAAGVFGFLLSVKRERSLSPWHLAVLWSAFFIVLRLLFYRRFMLQLDFFLLPFAGMGLAHLWHRFSGILTKGSIVFLILVQGYVSLQLMLQRTPGIDHETFAVITSLEERLPPDAFVLTAENESAAALLGWLPHHRVAGPGLFSLDWTYGQWEQLLYGTHEQRRELLATLPRPTYFVLTPVFYRHYQEYGEKFVADPCFEKITGAPLLRVLCTSVPNPNPNPNPEPESSS